MGWFGPSVPGEDAPTNGDMGSVGTVKGQRWAGHPEARKS